MVAHLFHRNIGRQIRLAQLLHLFINIIGYVYSIGFRLLAHKGQHAGLAVSAGKGILVLPIVEHISHFTNIHGATIMIGHNHLLNIIHGIILSQCTHRDFHFLAARLATGGVVIVFINSVAHGLVGNTIFLQLFGLQHNANAALAGANDRNLGNALHHLQLVLDIILDNTANFATGARAGGKGPRHNSTRVQVNCLRRRLINIIGQGFADTGNLLAHLTRLLLRVHAQIKLQNSFAITL